MGRGAHLGHGHGGEKNEKADTCTIIGNFSALSGFVSNLFLFASWIDLFVQRGDTDTLFSVYSWVFGAAIASIGTAGSTFSHFRLNTSNQESTPTATFFKRESKETDRLVGSEIKRSDSMSSLHSAQGSEATEKMEADDSEHEHDHDHKHVESGASSQVAINISHEDEPQPKANNDRDLTWLEFFLLGGDYLEHMGERAGPWVAVGATVLPKYFEVPIWGYILLLSLASVYGAFTGYADFRTCKNTMKKFEAIGCSPCCSR